MSGRTNLLIVACTLVTGVAFWASVVGAGLAEPTKMDPSVREGSARGGGIGRTRTHLVGGGIRHGK